VNQRKTLNHAEMDAIGLLDHTIQEVRMETDVEGDMEASYEVDDSTFAALRSTSTPLDGTVCGEDSCPAPMSAMEIAEGDDELDESDIDQDLERLLGDSAAVQQKKQSSRKRGCCSCNTRLVGNHTIVCGDYFDKTDWGVVGPHWYGPACVLAIVAWASFHFIVKALSIGPLTVSMCAIFALATTYNLIDTAFRNPGICTDKVRPEKVRNAADYIWCDFCSVFQPPGGAHCPDCNVCVAGYDHHCVWMGTCIGKKNFKQFVRFNLSWLFYLLYAVLWITVVAPRLYHSGK